MPCTVKSLTYDEIKTSVVNKSLLVDMESLKSQEDLHQYFTETRKAFVKVQISPEKLPTKVRNSIMVDPSDTIERYGLVKGEGILSSRVTDATTKKLLSVKGVELTRAMNTTPDNIIKADGGTRVHDGLSSIVNNLILEDKTGLVVSFDDIKGKTKREIMDETGLSVRDYDAMYEGVKDLFDRMVRYQQRIDPKGKVYIYSELFIMDSVSDEGGTIDLLAVYSNMSASILDFKTINPARDKVSYNYITKNMQLKSQDWIPFYKYDDFSTQLYGLKEILRTRYNIKTFNHSRIVPIHVEFQKKPGKDLEPGEKLTDKITQISIGPNQNKLLNYLPIGELTGNERLDEKINVLFNIKNNLILRLEKMAKGDPRRDALIADINRKQRVMDKLIIDRDLGLLIADFQTIFKRYHNGFGGLKDIDNELFEDGTSNPNYLSTQDLSDMRTDFEAYIGILQASAQFMVEMGISNEKAFKEYLSKIQTILGQVAIMTESLKNKYTDRILTEQEKESVKDARATHWWSQLFRSLSMQEHPVFRKFNNFIQTAFNKRRIGEQNMERELKTKTLAVEDWARTSGRSLTQVYKLFINENTGNIYAKHSKDFYNDLAKAQENENFEWLQKHLVPKKDIEDLIKQDFEIFNNRYARTEKEKKAWMESRQSKSILLDGKLWRKYYEINTELPSNYYSEGYKFLSAPGNEALLDFWNFYIDKMREALDALELRYDERLPYNFLPWIRADIVETLLQDGWTWDYISQNVTSVFKIKEDETFFGDLFIRGKVDPNTNQPIHDIPRFFINPLKNARGLIDNGMKSKNLGKSLFVFYSMAMNYKYLKSDVEPYVEGLKDIMMVHGVKLMNKSTGQPMKLRSGIFAKLKGPALDDVDLFQKMVDYHLYGVKIQDSDMKTSKALMGLKNFQQKKELAFALLTWVGSFVQIKTNSYFEGLKGFHYSTDQITHANGMITGLLGKEQKELFHYLVAFFEPSPGKAGIKAKNLGASWFTKYVNWDSAFYGFRVAEENVNETTFVAMLNNYTLDENGMPMRLKHAKPGSKSLLDSAKVVDGKLILDGVIDEKGDVNIDTYTALRNLGLSVSRSIKGQMNQEDMNAVNMTILGNLAMSFKNWMPGMLEERLSQTRYEPSQRILVTGKYNAFFQDLMEAKPEDSFITVMLHTALPRIGRLLLDIATFGSITKHGLRYKVSESRSKALFDKFKQDNPNDPNIQALRFEDWQEYRQGQIRSLSAELTIILVLTLLVKLLGTDWDDDGEVAMKRNLAARTAFRIMNRARRELAFMISTDDWQTFLRSPIPITGLAYDIGKWRANFFDEFGDLLYGEDDVRKGFPGFVFGRNKGADQKPVFTETLNWIPGNKFVRMFEPIDVHKKRDY